MKEQARRQSRRVMTCQVVMDLLPRGKLPPDLRAHVDGCRHCQAAIEAYQALAQDMVPTSPSRPVLRLSPRVAAELEAAASAPAARWWTWPALMGAVNGLLALFAVLAVGRHGLVLNRSEPAALAAVAVLIVFCALVGTFFATAPGFGEARKAVASVTLLTAGVVGLSGSGLPGTRTLLADGIPCLVMEGLLSAVPLLATLWMQRRYAFDPVRSLLACLSAGAVGLFALHFHCPIGTAQHLFLFHVAPWMALGMLGALVRTQIPSRSFAP
jgi:hypothetical protein